MFHRLSTDRDWELLARQEPYWSVSTHDCYRRENLTSANLNEFFQSGESQIDDLIQKIQQRLDPAFAPRRALDFGCGVGRLLMPLARRTEQAVGVDVSPSMLHEARQQLDSAGIANATLVQGDDQLSALQGEFDLITSFLVFQHIPVPRGEAIVRQLIGRMRDRAVGALHFTYAKLDEPHRPTLGTRWRRFRKRVRAWVRSFRGKPVMQMNDYSLSVLCRILHERGIRRIHVDLMPHGPILGALLMFQYRKEDA